MHILRHMNHQEPRIMLMISTLLRVIRRDVTLSYGTFITYLVRLQRQMVSQPGMVTHPSNECSSLPKLDRNIEYRLPATGIVGVVRSCSFYLHRISQAARPRVSAGCGRRYVRHLSVGASASPHSSPCPAIYKYSQ